MKQYILSIACLLSFTGVSMAHAATIYVDWVTGSDLNDGLSWSTAKKTINGGVDAAGIGDTVMVAEAVYPYRLIIDSSKTGIPRS